MIVRETRWLRLVPRLVALARDVAGLAAHVARLGAVGTVAGDVAGLVAVIAGLRRRLSPPLGTVPCDVARLVAVVTRRLVRALCALARYVPRAVTSVATVSLFLAIPRKVSCAVALEALLTLPIETGIPRHHAPLRAFAREMPGPVALVANA